MSNIVLKQVGTLATKMGLDVEARELVEVLKATAFKGQVNDAQMSALLVVANQYGLNPWTKEIYAFPDKNNGIVPVVGVDGWARIINEHPAFDGVEFEQDDQSCTCIMFRKDRSHAVKVTEYLSECRRPNAQPWQSHPKRMLRHKSLIQCARIAFGFVGIYDEDEAERITEKYMGAAEVVESQLLKTWAEKANASKTATDLAAVWADGVKALKEANDMAAYESFKSLVETRGRALKSSPPAGNEVVDVEFVSAMESEEAK